MGRRFLFYCTFINLEILVSESFLRWLVERARHISARYVGTECASAGLCTLLCSRIHIRGHDCVEETERILTVEADWKLTIIKEITSKKCFRVLALSTTLASTGALSYLVKLILLFTLLYFFNLFHPCSLSPSCAHSCFVPEHPNSKKFKQISITARSCCKVKVSTTSQWCERAREHERVQERSFYTSSTSDCKKFKKLWKSTFEGLKVSPPLLGITTTWSKFIEQQMAFLGLKFWGNLKVTLTNHQLWKISV